MYGFALTCYSCLVVQILSGFPTFGGLFKKFAACYSLLFSFFLFIMCRVSLPCFSEPNNETPTAAAVLLLLLLLLLLR